MAQTQPDVLVLSAVWPRRALVRAQLIEEGFEVAAVERWSDAQRWLAPGSKPRLAIVDLENLPEPDAVLSDLQAALNDRVLVLTGAGTLSPEAIERHGFQVVTRPIAMSELIATASRMLALL